MVDAAFLRDVFAKKVSEYLGVPNRGSRHDSTSFPRSLGFLRKLKCESVVLEICYLSNAEDRRIILSDEGRKKAAQGIAAAIKELYPLDGDRQKISLLRQLVELYQRLIAFLYARNRKTPTF